METANQIISYGFQDVALFIKREDLIHPFISGNKYRKLKYNLLRAKSEKKKKLLTFGGAFSNHIAAVAFAGKEQGLETIGIIRGEELAEKASQNPTLQFAKDCGMQLEFVSRADYRLKSETGFLDKLSAQFGDFYLIPEGGTNAFAIRGCEEILTQKDAEFDFICCAVGTGGTISGLISSAKPHQKVLGFPALKADFLQEEICKFAPDGNWELVKGYEFGGYGKISEELILFINDFKARTNVPLDPVYTGKMAFGVIDLIQKGYFSKGSQILMIHTGGLQGIPGMNSVLKNKNLPLIDIYD
ncbi:1-aminocyclopropane-1-carboxylate deaminase [Flavobacterium noncentrifugens]|uniref:1-aminocyclopropane-1-carboxylate deaminase n=1 Tax=Flavobacterium noncentrifugens TaxID=1128970 RepID=A0A1G8RCT0_9FLAO|nr:pyridoxal-phosphate dependent enzyme [Flavobacterium noncentrifugens]GEP49368.1 1-aminocyclopropane-1-carboxylate deaminase [Flavobacterium noncentrifugens]SDJ14345.1 1-aminocyclopropane-1-carboxylate deaminase [Flavobacterium noncentrifugens]